MLKDLCSFSDSPTPGTQRWYDVERQVHQESLEKQLIRLMAAPRGANDSRHSFLVSLGSWVEALKIHLWSIQMNPNEPGQYHVYRIRLKEALTRTIVSMVDDVSIQPQENGETVLEGSFVDQPALRGFLNQLWNLNFTILSIELVEIREFRLPPPLQAATSPSDQ